VTAADASDRTKCRVDQWLWFARLAKSRSLAARLCIAGLVAVNGATVRKPSQTVRVGDIVVVPQGRMRRTARIVAIGQRRGPAVEARRLYQEAAAAAPIAELALQWRRLLDETLDYASAQDLPGPMSR
jgi:ribosome-associated heat shock protein Hsp15